MAESPEVEKAIEATRAAIRRTEATEVFMADFLLDILVSLDGSPPGDVCESA